VDLFVSVLVSARSFVDHSTNDSHSQTIRFHMSPAPKAIVRLKARPREKARVNINRSRCALTDTGCPENATTIHKYNTRPRRKVTLVRYASSLSLANSTSVTLRAALLGLASDAPGRRVMTGTAAPTRRKNDVNIQVSPLLSIKIQKNTHVNEVGLRSRQVRTAHAPPPVQRLLRCQPAPWPAQL
jgi:hypothetical protein